MTSAGASPFNVFWVNHSDSTRDRKHPEGVSVEGNSPEIGDKAISIFTGWWVGQKSWKNSQITYWHTGSWNGPIARWLLVWNTRLSNMNIFHSTMAEIVFFLSSTWVNGSMGRQELLSGFSAAPESKNPQPSRSKEAIFFLWWKFLPPKKGHQKGESRFVRFWSRPMPGETWGFCGDFFVFICLTEGLDLHLIHLAVQGLTYTRLLRGFRMVRVLLETSDGLVVVEFSIEIRLRLGTPNCGTLGSPRFFRESQFFFLIGKIFWKS